MRSFASFTIAVIVGLCSIFLFCDHILDLVACSSSISQLLDTILDRNTLKETQAEAHTTTTDPVPEHLLQSYKLDLPPDTFLYATNMSVARAIRKVFLAVEQAEGAGARVRRSVGTPQLRNFSPFLMLDHFSVKPGAGFPDHPHRGQETITYLLEGAVDHEDFAGNKGTIGPGDLQFMTAGRGIMHAEMPAQNTDGSANVGLQLWVDLPTRLKMCEPRYRDLRADEIPSVDVDDNKVHVKVISGQSHGIDSVKDLAYTPVWILDVTVQPGGKVAQPLPAGWNAFAYVLEGQALFGEASNQTAVEQFNNVVFEPAGDVVYAEVDAGAEKSARFVLIAGTPLDQKVVQYGPFVLNSQEEVYQAFMDYQTQTNGFERAKGWESEIGKSMVH
ncbi:putative pirin [Lasiosphaeria miniovina]|uniref:Pirin n=1 Tax=Lasiosphaeria miniovina TaxID=1954250 RepID=A0AA40A0A4_9PEZI|nr:putative pirin [Lasiosphaeria miniovina]KAK0706917.1 putative pirin [Lasiosphaeria miniovina]